MGGSESKSTTAVESKILNSLKVENETVIMNKNSLESINETVNNISKSVINKAAQDCMASAKSVNNMKFCDLKAAGDINISDIAQTNEVTINLDCLQKSNIKTQIMTEIMKDVVSGIESLTDNAMANELMNKAVSDAEASGEAKATAEAPFLGIGSASSESNVSAKSTVENQTEISNKLTSMTENQRKFVNLVANTINEAIDNSDSKKCVNSSEAENKLVFCGADAGGNINIKGINQANVVKSITGCIQETEMGSAIGMALAEKIGIKIDDAVKVKSESKTEQDLVSKTKTEGKATSEASGFDYTGLLIAVAVIIVLLIIGYVLFKTL
jgi:beta-N-acetylglucosaminidase